MPAGCLFPGTKELSLDAGRTRPNFAEQVDWQGNKDKKILLIDKITLKKASYPTKLLIKVFYEVLIVKYFLKIVTIS